MLTLKVVQCNFPRSLLDSLFSTLLAFCGKNLSLERNLKCFYAIAQAGVQSREGGKAQMAVWHCLLSSHPHES
jgi:hypothetical protein